MKEITTKNLKSYNKTLVVGHDLSGYEFIAELLSASGMSLSKSLKKENIPATEISNILVKAHSNDHNMLEQLEISQVWDGLALDLLMSNKEKNWWGWSDSKAVSLLNYWKSIDSKMVFILVYDTPENFIKRTLNNVSDASHAEIQKAVDEWRRYNNTLLNFHYRNPECTLLVNTQQVMTDSTHYLEQVSNQIGIKNSNIKNNTIVDLQESFENEKNDDQLFSYLVNNLLEKYPDITNLFEELQSVANLPFLKPGSKDYDSLNAIATLFKEQKKSETLTTELSTTKQQNQKALEQEKYRKEKELSELSSTLTQKSNENNTLSTKLQTQKKQQIESDKEKTAENDLLLSQLMKVQESFEETYIEKQKSEKEITNLSNELKAGEQKSKKALAELSNTMIEKSNENNTLSTKLQTQKKQQIESDKEKTAENDLLLSQLMKVQESFEETYIEKQKSETEKTHYVESDKQKAEENSLLLTQLKQVQEETYLDKQKRLTTQLEVVNQQYDEMMINVKKVEELDFDEEFYLKTYPDLVGIDMDLLKHYQQYGKKEGRFKNFLEAQEILIKKIDEVGFDEGFYLRTYSNLNKMSMKPIEHYNNYGKKEGKFKNSEEKQLFLIEKTNEKKVSFEQLEAKLSKVQELKELSELLTNQLAALNGDFEDKKNEIKRHLSYRLGNAIIECFKTPFGFIKLPWALRRAQKEFKEDKKRKI